MVFEETVLEFLCGSLSSRFTYSLYKFSIKSQRSEIHFSPSAIPMPSKATTKHNDAQYKERERCNDEETPKNIDQQQQMEKSEKEKEDYLLQLENQKKENKQLAQQLQLFRIHSHPPSSTTVDNGTTTQSQSDF